MSITFACGLECGAATVGGIGFSFNTASMTLDATRARTGQRCLRAHPTGTATYAQHFLNTAEATSGGVFYAEFDQLPTTAGDFAIVIATVSAGTQPKITLTSAGVVKFGWPTTQTHPTTLVTGVKYRFEWRCLNNDGSGTKKLDLQIAVDNGTAVAGTQATLVEAGSNVTAWRVGAPGSSTTMDWYIDDFVLFNASGDYPIGPIQIDAIHPNADGTHSFTAGDFGDDAGTVLSSATTLWQKVNKALMPAAGDSLPSTFLEQIVTRTTGYLEFLFDITAIRSAPLAIVPIGAVQAETAANTTAFLKVNDNGTVTSNATINGTAIAVTTMTHIYKVALAVRPSTSTAWTLASMTDLRVQWGFSDDATPDVRLADLLIEVVQRPMMNPSQAVVIS